MKNDAINSVVPKPVPAPDHQPRKKKWVWGIYTKKKKKGKKQHCKNTLARLLARDASMQNDGLVSL